MPRARISNASFIASAELPLSSLLAPRVFTGYHSSRYSDRQNGKITRRQKETAARQCGDIELKETHAGPFVRAQHHISSNSSWYRVGGSAGGLLKTPQSGWISSSSKLNFTPVEHCYVDIFSVAREFTRRYHVTRTRTSSRTTTPSGPKPLVLEQRGEKLAVGREHALAVQRARLQNYVAHESDTSLPSLMKQGQYRSLRRRIMNLEHWDETQVNLHRQQDDEKDCLLMTRALAALDRSLYPAIGQHTQEVELQHDPMCLEWSARVFPDAASQSLEQTWENWAAMDIWTRRSSYERLMVYLLDRKPARAMQFIQVLASDRFLRGQKAVVIADALGYLAKLHSQGVYETGQGWNSDKRAVRRAFVSDLVHVFQQALFPHRRVCSQDLLYNLVNIADAKDLRKVFRCLDKHRAYLGFDTILHYANAFAEAGDVASALRCLDILRSINTSNTWRSVSDRERLRWTCALILRRSMSQNQEYHETPAIVAAMVRLGIKMDLLLYNVVMRNAMEARDYATAFKVYNTLEDNGLEADKHTYSILLHGCTIQDDRAMFSQFAQHCADMAEEFQDPWLATDYLYYLYLRHHRSSDKARVSAELQQAYLRFFSDRFLDLLGIGKQRTLSARAGTEQIPTNTAKFDPPPMALYILYQAHIQEALTRSTRHIAEMYERFKYHVHQGNDPALSMLASNPTIWNAFLLAFCSKQQFASASQLIKDMSDASLKPNIYTWNIFMQAFFKTGQVQAAERVFEILRSRGIDPDQYTYGVLLLGYAKSQHVERIGEVIQHLDADQEMEPIFLQALGGIHQRNKLMLILEKTRLHKESKAQEKVKFENEEEEQRWTPPRLGLDAVEADSFGADRGLRRHASVGTAGAEPLDEATGSALHIASTSTPEPALNTEIVYNAEPTEAAAQASSQESNSSSGADLAYKSVASSQISEESPKPLFRRVYY